MGSITRQIGREGVDGDIRTFNDGERAAVLRELDAILNSPVFQSSKRCQQFLSYVVQHRLEGNQERLKERIIGVDLFQRPAGYATGDDPVVRVQAGEVRRRLDQYYQTAPKNLPVRIKLHVGTYTPEFKWAEPALGPADSGAFQSSSEALEAPHPTGSVQESFAAASQKSRPSIAKHKPRIWVLAAVGLIALTGLVLIGSTIYRSGTHPSALQRFWAPALSSPEPILICLAKPTVYLPSVELYQRHSGTSDKFMDQYERFNQKPDLQPEDKLVWSDMVELPDYGIAVGDVYTAVRLSSLFGQIGKKNQVRIEGNYTFEDMRNSPAIIIGAFNNRWTMQMTANLHFSYASEDSHPFIREEGPKGRRWYSKTRPDDKAMEDYAVVTRLLNSSTGKFVVIVAGLKSYSTQAAGEFVTSPEYLQAGLQSVSPDWEKKNMQIVLQTPVTDGLPGSPQVVASYVW
jgi:hypothetical protein